jgi:hypothetical protein
MAKKSIEEVSKDLEKHVSEMFESEAYKAWLNTNSLFPQYSLNNTLMINHQRPDATRVCGYKAWNKMNRQVKAGEKGIKIYVPFKRFSKEKILDKEGNPVLDEDGKPKVRKTEWVTFGLGTVFDVSQTEGEPLPSIKVSELTDKAGEAEGYGILLDILTRICPVPVSFEEFNDSRKGSYDKNARRIKLSAGMSRVQTIKTLLHEMTHEMLHSDDCTFDEDTMEIQAESVAYTVCQHYDIDTSDYSFGYIAGWASDKGIEELKASLDIICLASHELINEIDMRLGCSIAAA